MAFTANANTANDPRQTQPPSPQEYLARLAGKDYELLFKIAQCESGWYELAQNKTSSAGGLFQFLDSTWYRWGNGLDKFNPYANIDAAVRLYRAEGTMPWLASKSCWQS